MAFQLAYAFVLRRFRAEILHDVGFFKDPFPPALDRFQSACVDFIFQAGIAFIEDNAGRFHAEGERDAIPIGECAGSGQGGFTSLSVYYWTIMW